MSAAPVDGYGAVIDVISKVAQAPARPDERLRTLSDALTDMLDSPSGLMVHGAPAGFDVRALQGKAPKGFAYLDEGLEMAVDQCYADMP